jgi:hypothetical protein
VVSNNNPAGVDELDESNLLEVLAFLSIFFCQLVMLQYGPDLGDSHFYAFT